MFNFFQSLKFVDRGRQCCLNILSYSRIGLNPEPPSKPGPKTRPRSVRLVIGLYSLLGRTKSIYKGKNGLIMRESKVILGVPNILKKALELTSEAKIGHRTS